MSLSVFDDTYFMKEALKEAQKAAEKGEVPVGAVIVCRNRIIAKAHNETERLTDVTAHAERVAITSASNSLGGKYLHECTLYVTLEPCVMCAGALYWSQIDKIVIGAPDLERGFYRLSENILHPKTELVQGVIQNECSQLVKDFFRDLRKN